MANTDSRGFSCSDPMFPASEIALIREVVTTCRGLSRKELANTISELVGWTRANGSLKEDECLVLLGRLEAAGLLTLPQKQQTRPVGARSPRFRKRLKATRECHCAGGWKALLPSRSSV